MYTTSINVYYIKVTCSVTLPQRAEATEDRRLAGAVVSDQQQAVAHLEFGGIVASETEAPNMLANLV